MALTNPKIDSALGKHPFVSRPERPIEATAEDLLGREGFVRRIVSATISARTGKATGVVIGINGPWGSGKSSILNLLQARIKEEHGEAVVVRFDPWLISGRNDLISAFISELLGAIKAQPKAAKAFKSATATLTKYGKHLVPAVNWLTPGLGPVIVGAVAGLGARVSPDEGLTALKAKLIGELSRVDVPIVILIDEIDRLDDTEIRSVAQLVRAVVDFPSLSYILAYDADRVTEALGAGAPVGQEQERGRAYLEKIVQLQLPLPLTLKTEISSLIGAGLEGLTIELGLEEQFFTSKRYEDLLEVISGEIVSTPRDVNRLIRTYQVLAGMLGDEVDKVDLLAYSALMIKAPGIIAAIRRDPGLFSEDIMSRQAIEHLVSQDMPSSEKLKLPLPEGEDTPEKRAILEFLFPTFGGLRRSRGRYRDRLSDRRPLLTTLRLGLLPGAYSKVTVDSFVSEPSTGVQAKLAEAYAEGTIDELVDRLDDLYPDLSNIDHVSFWKGVAAFVRKSDCNWMLFDNPMHNVIRDLASILERSVRRNETVFAPIATAVFTNLRNAEEDVLTAAWLRSHVFSYGLFKQRQQSGRPTFLTKDQTQELGIDMSQSLRKVHILGNLIPCRWDLQPVYTMIDTGVWDDVCRDKMDAALQDGRAVDGFALMLFGRAFTTERSMIERMCSLNLFSEAVQRRLNTTGEDRPHKTVVVALEKSLSDHW